ncbi:MAG: isoprenyl transferase [Chlorobiaceae bacterium]|jgi:undecaprenyl diphosphate synthase|nr:isoprenyl transferase [Chlorobiaceae bacterium]NTW63696.1 isoprenyl transferase [Chlorobiaceae bacterium]
MARIRTMDLSPTFRPRWFTTVSDAEDKKIQADLKASCDLPEHIAIIMDGNGRWAKLKGKTRIEGHIAGVESVRDIVEASRQLGISCLTLFTFSTENWNRPEKEISALMRLLIKVLRKEARALHDNNIKLNVIGNTALLPEKVQTVLDETMALTGHNNGLVLSIALSYSGKWDIVEACRSLAKEVKAGRITPEMIDEHMFETCLSTGAIPDPELLIRTSGEYRVSNFMLWQSAYSEIYFTKTYWPDFKRTQFYAALRDYLSRERRFGQTSEQVQKKTTANSKI